MSELSLVSESTVFDSAITLLEELFSLEENYERKISELQSKLSQLKDLMMAVISKSNNESPLTSSQGLSKRPQVGPDTEKVRYHSNTG